MLTRLRAALRPDWTRTTAARRAAAGALVVLAAFVALRPDPDSDQVDVVVAAHDLPAGNQLGADDVRIEKRSAATVPDGTHAGLDAVAGATLASPARRGEILTDVRILGPRHSEAVVGPRGRIVPVQLADAAILDLIRPGDVVDVLATAPSGDGTADVLATDAVVVLVSGKPGSAAERTERVVLVALPAPAANKVAAAALTQSVTLTFH